MRPRASRSTTLGGAVGRDPAELDPVRQHEQVRREAMPAEVRRLPQPLRGDVLRQRVVDGYAEARAARVTPAVGADEKDRALGRFAGLEIGVEKPVECVQLLPGKGSALLVDGRPNERGAVAPVRPAHQHDLARERLQGRTDGGGHRRVEDSVSAPGAADLDQEPAHSLGGRPRQRLSRGKRCSGAGDRLAHAGSRSASRRPRAGSMPSSAAKARYSRSAFAVSRPGRETARSRTFFAVCSSSTNSSIWTS